MSTPIYANILALRYPDLIWNIVGNDYSTLNILSGGAKPLQSDLDALWPVVESQLNQVVEVQTKQQIFQGQYDLQTQLVNIMLALSTGDNTTVNTMLLTWENL